MKTPYKKNSNENNESFKSTIKENQESPTFHQEVYDNIESFKSTIDIFLVETKKKFSFWKYW
jgi:hypothetical protein